MKQQSKSTLVALGTLGAMLSTTLTATVAPVQAKPSKGALIIGGIAAYGIYAATKHHRKHDYRNRYGYGYGNNGRYNGGNNGYYGSSGYYGGGYSNGYPQGGYNSYPDRYDRHDNRGSYGDPHHNNSGYGNHNNGNSRHHRNPGNSRRHHDH